jgi:hypothetical protein
MTPSEWISHAGSEMRAEYRAGNSINTAAAEALESLLGGWEESIGDEISCSVLVHDLLEVGAALQRIHDDLKAKLPGVLDELAAIK